ncbi:MAG TPA: substrate-binding domain-containing protein [Candidatus Angelobacter sp.]|jgi:ABC-type sugar transport system substrate-binding protein|nr:substrate-binding domain-containing protein [Candidatus Angelobacter sp.]
MQKKLSFVISLPGENNYLSEQAAAAKATAERLNVEVQIINALSDPVVQSQQLLEIIQSRSGRPDGIVAEPVTNAGLPRVAEAAVNAGIAWVISNAQVDYTGALRKIAKAPVFALSQDHVEIGRMQGRQFGAILPKGGSILYLRGPASNFLASQRAEGIESTTPGNIQTKTLKIQWTEENAYKSVTSWLRLQTVRAEQTHLISSQNIDFILAARRAFQDCTTGAERAKWLSLPYTAAGVPRQIKPLVDNGTLAAAIITSVTMDVALEMLVKGIQNGLQPAEHIFLPASSYPLLEALARKPA